MCERREVDGERMREGDEERREGDGKGRSEQDRNYTGEKTI